MESTILPFMLSVLSVLFTPILALPIPTGANQTTLLTVLSQQPNLSMFSDLIQKSGGSRPNPAFEERFNSALDTRNYTAFVPSNAAMSAIPPATLSLLSRPQSYPLLESLVRLHIAEGLYTASNLTMTSPPPKINSIEGFPLSVAVSPTQNNVQTFTVNQAALNLTDIPASNGRIHTLDRLLNPYPGYFGISNSTTAPIGGITRGQAQKDTTMAGILGSDPRLSTLNKALADVDPEFLQELSLSRPRSADQIYLAPSNDALQNVAIDSLRASSNSHLSAYLLKVGMLKGDLAVLNIMAEGRVESLTGLNVPVKKRGEAVVVGNAAVVARDVCASNGCIWIVDKMLDPLSGALTKDIG